MLQGALWHEALPWLQLSCKSMERHCCLLGVARPNGSKGGEKRGRKHLF